MIHHGDIPKELIVCHKCDNKLCVNPSHLFLGTTQDNVAGRVSKGRTASGEANGISKNPHLVRGASNGNAKLSEEEARRIKEWIHTNQHATIKGIADRFEIKYSHAHAFKRGILWRHIIIE